jgi:hypothetical protein
LYNQYHTYSHLTASSVHSTDVDQSVRYQTWQNPETQLLGLSSLQLPSLAEDGWREGGAYAVEPAGDRVNGSTTSL